MERNLNTDHRIACIFPSATCNLQCVYCNIEKNSHLFKIDKILEESFLQEDYYLNFFKELFPQCHQLERLETWGGEPFLHIERIYSLIHQLIEHYPFFYQFFSSTNFSFPGWDEKLWGVIEEFGKHPERNFQIEIQLSMDGPENMNDANRGNGVTKKCLDNYHRFIEQLDTRLPKNIHLHIAIKNTLNLKNIEELNTPDKIIDYYSFFEREIINPLVELNIQKSKVSITPGIPNMATPMPATKMDGIRFKEFVKSCRAIEKQKILKFYKSITPFRKIRDYIEADYRQPCFGCGDGWTRVGLLPNNYVTFCNEGFLYIADDYLSLEKKKTDKIIKSANQCLKNLCLTKEQYALYQKRTRYFLNESTMNISASTASYICMLAACGLIDKKYLNVREAVTAGNYITSNIAFCAKDNYGVTGSKSLIPDGHFKLLLNGALEYILEEQK